MNNSQRLAELIKGIDGSYLTEAEKNNALLSAERSETLVELVFAAYNSVKNAIIKLKTALVPSIQAHKHQA
ncbi:hypothetical protein [Marinomonas pollencensis]|uniref:Uncharacterized protein n=1 Tax=Marinomonas pollencensis TaxID=491954 RepID=A0A3E0DHT6_9GAMM|nr:hypothetical protein [Marinomonas pollencensis]REG81321.1 hypothetical protein DFP81_11542 [Marinomonas pollencensis]